MVFWLMMGPNQPNHRFHLGEKAMFHAVTGQKNIDKAQSILLQIYKIIYVKKKLKILIIFVKIKIIMYLLMEQILCFIINEQ